MAISPLDLQTLFTQMDKISRQEIAQKDGAALLQSIQHTRIQQQLDEKVRTVNEAQDTGEGAEAINDKTGRKAGQEGKDGEDLDEAEDKNKDNDDDGIIRDPALGRNIDVSL